MRTSFIPIASCAAVVAFLAGCTTVVPATPVATVPSVATPATTYVTPAPTYVTPAPAVIVR
jgi:hypothetical protein